MLFMNIVDNMALVGRELPEDVIGLIREFAKPVGYPYYQTYCETLRVLRLQKWATLYDHLENDDTEYFIPLLVSYQEAVVNRMNADQAVVDHYNATNATIRYGTMVHAAEGERLSYVYVDLKRKEDRLFEQLTEELYGRSKTPWELRQEMVTTLEISPKFRQYLVYNEAKRVLRLRKWTTLFDQLHTDAEAILPLLSAYQEAMIAQSNVEQQLHAHFSRFDILEYVEETFKSEEERLNALFSEKKDVADLLFTQLTQRLYP